MGAWGSGVLDDDNAWDFLGGLADTPVSTRALAVVEALETVASGAARIVDEEVAGLTAALLVAMARDPKFQPKPRGRIVQWAADTRDLPGFRELVGDLDRLRTDEVAGLALRTLEALEHGPELAELWEGDAGFAGSLAAVAAGLRAPLGRWAVATGKARGPAPLRKTWVPGAVIAVDLGDGHRGFLQLLQQGYVRALDLFLPVDAPLPDPAELLTAPAAFSCGINEFHPRPRGWQTVVEEPGDRPVPAVPPMFRQEIGRVWRCSIVLGGDGGSEIPATPQECVGLDPWGVGWSPETVEARLQHHRRGMPFPELQHYLVRLSQSLFRVCPRAEVEQAERLGRYPAAGQEGPRGVWFCDFLRLPELLVETEPGREDLVLLEVDGGMFHLRPETGQVRPHDIRSMVVTFTPWIRAEAVLAVHPLVRSEAGYTYAEEWEPRYP